jgi:hypothetical protein
MRRLQSIILLTFFLLLAGAAVAAAGPSAVPTEPIKDFDVVPKGEVIRHTFEIQNTGDAPLAIEDVRPACGCTVVQYDDVIPPGKTGSVRAEVTTDDFFGPISKSIAVFTNDPQNPKLQLVVKAQIRPFINALPGYARFLYVQEEMIMPVRQVLWSDDENELKILDATSESDKVKVSFSRMAPGDPKFDPEIKTAQWAVDILLDPSSEVGTLREFVDITTDHPRQKTVRLPVTGFVRPRQHVTPQEVDFGKLQGDALPLRRTFHFTNFITAAIDVAEVETGIAGLTAKVEKNPAQPGHRFTLVLTLGPEMPKGAFDTVVKIHITDAKNPVVELPVKGVVL